MHWCALETEVRVRQLPDVSYVLNIYKRHVAVKKEIMSIQQVQVCTSHTTLVQCMLACIAPGNRQCRGLDQKSRVGNVHLDNERPQLLSFRPSRAVGFAQALYETAASCTSDTERRWNALCRL